MQGCYLLPYSSCSPAFTCLSGLQAGGLDGLRGDEQKLRKAIEFAAATGGYTTTQLGGIAAQPTYQQAMDLLSTADFAKSEE